MAAERSAARLAHQSGGLGVPGSNPGAPTKILKYFKYFMELRAFADQGEDGTERHQSAHIGTESPGGVPELCSLLVARHIGLLNRPSAPTAGPSSTSEWCKYGLE
jgi:hypothetical protein